MEQLNNESASGAQHASSAAEEVGQNSDLSSGQEEERTYNAKFVEKLMREKKNQTAHLNELKQFKEQYEQEKLIEKEQFSKVLELKDNQLKELQEKINSFHTRESENKKTSAIVDELKKFGFQDEPQNREIALKLFDKSNVEIDPTTNVVLGAEIAAKAFYEKYNSFPIFGKQQVKTAMQAPSYQNPKLSKSLKDMSKDEHKTVLRESLGKIFRG